MKKHLKILATLGLTMPLALTSVQANNVSTTPMGVLGEGTQVETEESEQNMVLNRISDFTLDNQDQVNSGHVNVHNDRQPHTDHHTDRESSTGSHTDTHSDTYGTHTDRHIDE